jgi:hypothetical protein
MVRRDTELVIEGFPRSANTFAVVAFEIAQQRKVRIAHHLHAQAQVIRAVTLGIPACILIRKPLDAIRSLMVRHKHVTWTAALLHYLGFYEELLSLRSQFVIATFEQVISDFGAVVDRINRRFGTQFLKFVHAGDALQKVMSAVDRINMGVDGGRSESLARPSSARDSLKEAVSTPIKGHEIEMLRRAESLFQAYREF